MYIFISYDDDCTLSCWFAINFNFMGRIPVKGLKSKHAQSVLTKYEAYLANPSLAAQDHPLLNRPKSVPLYLTPFGLTVPAGIFVKASAFDPVVTEYVSFVNTGGTRVKQTLAATDNAYKFYHYHAPRVSIRTGRAATGTRVQSKTSGLPYKRYGGTSRSIPFGRSTANETQDHAFLAIKTAILARNDVAVPPLVTLIKEVFAGV